MTLQTIYLPPDHPAYPAGIRGNGIVAPPPILSAIGNPAILKRPVLALFCSAKCPDDLVLQTSNLVQVLCKGSIPIVSGFHSPVEKACLKLLMQGDQSIIHCPARSLEGMRLSQIQRTAIQSGQLLLLSAFPAKQRRATKTLAEKRNQLVGTIACVVFIVYATPGGRMETFARQLSAQGKPLFTFDSPANSLLLRVGAQTLADTYMPDPFSQHMVTLNPALKDRV